MRVIGGTLGGRALRAPDGTDTRPTPALVRGAVFAALEARVSAGAAPPLAEWTALDLFAGTGALGIEALSRGCAQAWLVERAPAALRALRANVADLGLEGRAHVVAGPVERFLRDAPLRDLQPQLVMADPPYAAGAAGVLESLADAAWLPASAFVVLQHASREELPARSGNLARMWCRLYGASGVSIFVPG
jgi:16S rRNA (guanine966-N2)-methyltransferase